MYTTADSSRGNMSDPNSVERFNSCALTPGQAILSSTSYDVFAPPDIEPTTILPGSSAKVSTGLKIDVGNLSRHWILNTQSRLKSRCALVNHTIVGVPQGELFILVSNCSREELSINRGDLIAEVCIMRYGTLPVCEREDGLPEIGRAEEKPGVVGFKKLHSEAIIPSRPTPQATMFGISTIDDGNTTLIPPGHSVTISTGISMNCRSMTGCFAQVATCADLISRNGSVAAMIFDNDFEGELIMQVFNNRSSTDLELGSGQALAKLLFVRSDTPPVFEIVSDPTTGQEDWILLEEPLATGDGGH
uniref:dUTP diphosphatase n=1 Tax=Trachysalambria curvirostris nimavirus TaxID=2984282 RepID=A0A9C7CEB0_9VIRU|nr:MAG: dUTPase protein [Trachysalambria curvirostris nimavirus]